MSPDDGRKCCSSQYERMFDTVHWEARTSGCTSGNVTGIISGLSDFGLDVLNPVQLQAVNVETLAACRRNGCECR